MGGRSLIVDAKGEVLADATEEETILRATIDNAQTTAWRERFPALGDRRLSRRVRTYMSIVKPTTSEFLCAWQQKLYEVVAVRSLCSILVIP